MARLDVLLAGGGSSRRERRRWEGAGKIRPWRCVVEAWPAAPAPPMHRRWGGRGRRQQHVFPWEWMAGSVEPWHRRRRGDGRSRGLPPQLLGRRRRCCLWEGMRAPGGLTITKGRRENELEGWGGRRDKKDYDKWAPRWVVGMEYRI
jgi:hypothetical protein